MVYCKRWVLIAAILMLGLSVMCGSVRSQQFSGPKNVSNNADYSFTPQIAVDAAGNIYMAWEDDTANNSNILFSRSTDGGVTFSTPTNLSATMTTASFSVPQIAADTAANINVVWESDTGNLAIWFSGSSDGGATFSSPQMVSTNTDGSLNPQIAVDKNGSINVVWEDDIANHSDVSFSRSTDKGAHFSPARNLSNPLGNCIANSNTPRIGLDAAANINVVWTNDCGGNFDIFLSRSADNGATFSFPKNLSATPGLSGNPQLFVDAAGSINVVWEESTPADILFVRSGDAGATFSSAQNLSHNSGSSTNAQLTVDARANINVAWEDTTPGNQDIFFTRSTDSGATFLSTPLNLSNNSGLSAAVQIATDKSGDINVAWQDSTPGVSQVLFSRMTGNIVTNHPPVADAGLDQTVQSTGSGGTLVTLDGSKSSDADGDVLSFVWKDELGNVVGTTAVVQVTVQVGTHTFTLTVSDPGGLSSAASTVITVQAVNHPPVAVANPDQTLQYAGQSMRVKLDGSKSSDPDGDVLSFVWKDELGNVVGTTAVVQVTVQVGTHTFTLTVSDPGDLSSMATTHVTVRDTTAPSLTVTLTPNALWPPNHRLVQVTATVVASDSCDPNPAVVLLSITSNEPDDGLGDGDQPNDIQAVGGGPVPFGTDVQSFLLRAERSGMGTGRIYTITYMARDASGNQSLASAQVSVGSQTTNPTSKRWDRDAHRDSDRKSDRESERKSDRKKDQNQP